MTSADFIILAKVVARNRPRRIDNERDEGADALWAQMRDDLADTLGRHNSRFNRAKWLEAIEGYR